MVDDEPLLELAGVTLRLVWLDERWLLTRDDAPFVCWLRAGVLDTFLVDVVLVADAARVVLLLVARGVAVVLRFVLALLRLVAARLFVLGVTARLFVLGVTARLFVLVARVPVLRLFCVGRTALLLSVLRAVLRVLVAVPLALGVVDGVVARALVLVRLVVALARSCVLAVRAVAERTLAASVTRAGRAALRGDWLTSGRYMFTVRSLTVALPGRDELAICLTATRLLVTRWISLCFGPLTYVRLLYTYVLLMIVVRL